MSRPTIEWDDDNEVATIDGTRYSYDYLRGLGQHGSPIGTIFQITQRGELGEGDITLTRRYDLEEKEGSSDSECETDTTDRGNRQ